MITSISELLCIVSFYHYQVFYQAHIDSKWTLRSPFIQMDDNFEIAPVWRILMYLFNVEKSSLCGNSTCRPHMRTISMCYREKYRENR